MDREVAALMVHQVVLVDLGSHASGHPVRAAIEPGADVDDLQSRIVLRVPGDLVLDDAPADEVSLPHPRGC
jgi:hypothetical protein